MLDKELMTEIAMELDNKLPNVPYLFFSSVAQMGLQELKDRLWVLLNE
jgi:GTP-binding protein